jgi:hypothetical protein
MHCKKEGCEGELTDGICPICGSAPVDSPDEIPEGQASSGMRQAVTKSMKMILDVETLSSKDDLLRASEKFESMVPDDFASWRLQANMFVSAITQLKTRQMEPDQTVTLMGVPLTEVNLRHACEKALRNCAHFAPSFEDRVALIDEANSVRQPTWF